MIKTKLVATVGPGCDREETIGAMIDAGVNVMRLNFSHGTLESHAASLERIRNVAADRNAIVAVMGDLCGPKIRLGLIAGGECELVEGSQVVFQREPIEGTPERLSSNYESLIDDVDVNHRVLIDDGNVLLRVTEKRDHDLVCKVQVGGTISNRKGINLPDSEVSAPALSEKDRKDLSWAIEHDLDYVALSFVRRAEDLMELRGIIDAQLSRLRIVSKIEKPEAVKHLEPIIAQSDAVLVARGDLGVEMDVSRVPIIQKEITLLCRRAGKPVIIATQMLQSMVDAPVPTRAEVSDVANAILDGADAVMLSAETSIGRYPLHAVRMIRHVAAQTESFGRRYSEELATVRAATLPIATAIVRGAGIIAGELQARLVAVWTRHGDTPRLLSKHRIDQPIIALAPNQGLCRQMALLYGVQPIEVSAGRDYRDTLAVLDRVLLEQEWAQRGEEVVVTGDLRPDMPGETDALLIHVVGSSNESPS